MQENYLYEYAVVRLVPRVEREEFVNVGIILFSKKAKYLQFRYHIHEDKINVLDPKFDIDFLHDNLVALNEISRGSKLAGPIAMLDIPERFRWLTAVRSSSIQTSRPHPGFSFDLDQTVDQLFQELIL